MLSIICFTFTTKLNANLNHTPWGVGIDDPFSSINILPSNFAMSYNNFYGVNFYQSQYTNFDTETRKECLTENIREHASCLRKTAVIFTVTEGLIGIVSLAFGPAGGYVFGFGSLINAGLSAQEKINCDEDKGIEDLECPLT